MWYFNSYKCLKMMTLTIFCILIVHYQIFWRYKGNVLSPFCLFWRFFSLFFAISLSFSYRWEKYSNFLCLKTLNVYFSKEWICVQSLGKKSLKCYTFIKMWRRDFFHFDSPENSQANLIVWLLLLTNDWSNMKRIRQERRGGKGGGWLWMWKLYLHTHEQSAALRKGCRK